MKLAPRLVLGLVQLELVHGPAPVQEPLRARHLVENPRHVVLMGERVFLRS